MVRNYGSAGTANNILVNPNEINDQVKQQPKNNQLAAISQIFSDKFNEQNSQLNELTKRISQIDITAEENLKEVNRKLISSERKSIEAIAIISSIIGLGVGFVSAGAGQKDAFTTTITLILTISGFAIFATLIHLYFNDEGFVKKSKDILNWTVCIMFTMLILAIIGQNGLSKLFFKIINPREPNQIVLFNQLFSINKVNPSPSPSR